MRFSLFCCALMVSLVSAVCNADINTNNVARLFDKGEFVLAAEVLREGFSLAMSRAEVDVAIGWIEKLSLKLPGGEPSLVIRKFVPPDANEAFEKISSREIRHGDWNIPSGIVKIGSWLTSPGIAWKNDAQRVVVAEEMLGRTRLITADEAQHELDRFDAVKGVVDGLNEVVDLGCKSGENLEDYLGIRRRLNNIKESLKRNRTRYLSYEVVSPYLYEAHANLFVGIADSWRASSFNKANPWLVEKCKTEGIKLLAKSCHQKWLYSCSEDVRDQFVEIQKYLKNNAGECELEEYKIIMTMSDCNDPSKLRGADSWWK